MVERLGSPVTFGVYAVLCIVTIVFVRAMSRKRSRSCWNKFALAQLSIVVPVYDNWWLTARCLSELNWLHRSGSVLFETIVVDNASIDETPEAIDAFPWVRYLRHGRTGTLPERVTPARALPRRRSCSFSTTMPIRSAMR